MRTDQEHIERTASNLAKELRTSKGQERWRVDPLSVLTTAGLSFETLDDGQKYIISRNLASINLQEETINWKCVTCQSKTFSILLGIETVVVLVVIAALISVFASGEGEAAAAAAAVDLDATEVAEAAEALESAEEGAVATGAEATGVSFAGFASACVKAFKSAAKYVIDHPATSFVGSSVVMQFDRVLADEICKEKGHCT